MFHCAAAEIEMKRGKHGAASKHLRAAEKLCAALDDCTVRAISLRLVANAALIASEPQAGLPAIRQSVAILEKQGARFALVAPLTTLASVDLAVGNLDEAESALRRAFDWHADASYKLALLDTLLNVNLRRKDLQRAAEQIAAIDDLGVFDSHDYYWLWHVPSRARYLIAIGRDIEAHDLVKHHREIARSVGDHRLLALHVLADVEARIAIGDKTGAAQGLADAAASLPTITLEDLVDCNS
jgi:hypothetical protein